MPKADFVGCFKDHTPSGVCDLPYVIVSAAAPFASSFEEAQSSGCTERRMQQRRGQLALLHRADDTVRLSFLLVCSVAFRLRRCVAEHRQACNVLCSRANAANSSLGLKYFANQAGHACFCGVSYGSQGKAPAADCDVACTGDPEQTCGGMNRNAVWKIRPVKLDDEAPPPRPVPRVLEQDKE